MTSLLVSSYKAFFFFFFCGIIKKNVLYLNSKIVASVYM